MQKKITSPVAMGLIISLILIVCTIVVYFAGLYTQTWSQYIGFVILVGGILYAILNHGKEREYEAGFGNLFAFGFKVTAVITCIMILYSVASVYIFPDMKTRIMEISREKALQNTGGASEEQIEQGMAMFEKNFTLFIVLGILFWYMLLGVLFSLLGAAITKKRPKTPFENA